MAEVRINIGPDTLMPAGKAMIALRMYEKGRSFIRAGLLLRANDGDESVVLYCLCQGFEVMLKGLLLMRNYDEYRPKLRRIGHDLVAAATTAATELRMNPPRGQFLKELGALNVHYGGQFLRYGSMFDLFFDPKQQPTEAFMRKLSAIIGLADAKACDLSKSLWTKPTTS